MLNAKNARELTSTIIDIETERKLDAIISNAANKAHRSVKVYNLFYSDYGKYDAPTPAIHVTEAVIKTLKEAGYELDYSDSHIRFNEDVFEYIIISW